MRVEKSGSLTNAARRATASMDRIGGRVEGIARDVAAGVRTEPGESSTRDIGAGLTELSQLKMEMRANVRVFETAGSLLLDTFA